MKTHLNTLYLTQDGSWLSLDGESLSITLADKKKIRIPLHNIEAIQSFGWDIMYSPALMAKCAQLGVSIGMCNPYGKLLCRICGYSHGNILLRRAQYRIAENEENSLKIARNIVAAKIHNSRQILLRASREHRELETSQQGILNELSYSIQYARLAPSRPQLLGIEGNAAGQYFSLFPNLITNPDFHFGGRTRRPPKDPVNALLSFAYSLLSNDCRSALEACGLDSAMGMYHQPRPGRASLALDLMEELRAPFADRLCLSLINRKQVKAKDFIEESAGGIRMSDETRKKFLIAWQARKKEQIIHPYLQEKISIGMIAHIQARLLAQYLRGALDEYPAMIWK